jgi:hypothetical protein
MTTVLATPTSTTCHLQRRALLDHLDRIVTATPPDSTLVLTGGDGLEALHLARRHHVVAAAASRAALDQLRAAAEALDLGHRLTCERLDPGKTAEAHLPYRFDLVVAGFGCLDRVPPDGLPALAEALADWVRAGGRMVLVGRPRLCLWESLWFARHLDWDRATDRFRQRPGSDGQATWCHGWTSLYRHLRPAFRVLALVPLGVTTPPLSVAASSLRRPPLMSTLERLERPLRRVPLLSAMSDHYLLDLRRRHDAVPAVLPAPAGAH